MWSAIAFNSLYPLTNMSHVPDEKNGSTIPCLLDSRFHIHVSSELFSQRSLVSRSVTQAPMNHVISCKNFAWLPSRNHFAWWLSHVRDTHTASCDWPYVSSSACYKQLEVVNSFTSSLESVESVGKLLVSTEAGRNAPEPTSSNRLLLFSPLLPLSVHKCRYWTNWKRQGCIQSIMNTSAH